MLNARRISAGLQNLWFSPQVCSHQVRPRPPFEDVETPNPPRRPGHPFASVCGHTFETRGRLLAPVTALASGRLAAQTPKESRRRSEGIGMPGTEARRSSVNRRDCLDKLAFTN